MVQGGFDGSWLRHKSLDHPAYQQIGPRFESCTTDSQKSWPKLASNSAFQSQQMLKRELRVHGRTQRAAWTDFTLEARCNPSHTTKQHCVTVDKISVAELRNRLRNRTLLMIGDSVMGQVYGFLSCWLLAGSEGVTDEILSAHSTRWLHYWHEAMRERAGALNVNMSHPVLVRGRPTRKQAWPLHTAGSVVAFPDGGPTIAFLNNRLNLPKHTTWHSILRDWYLPVLAADHTKQPPQLQGSRGVVILANYGLHANVDVTNASLLAHAEEQQAADFTSLVSSFMRSLRLPTQYASWDSTNGDNSVHVHGARQTPRNELLLLETTPQHFASTTGLYSPLIGNHEPCAASIPSSPDGLANWRNVAMVRGMKRALGHLSWPSNHSTSDKPVRVVPAWEALARLSGFDCHGHHLHNRLARHPARLAQISRTATTDAETALSAINTAADPVERLAQGSTSRVDCTHLSPDALLYLVQTIVAAIK